MEPTRTVSGGTDLMGQKSPAEQGQETALVEYVDFIGRHREGRRAVHIHLSKLREHNRREHHMRIAVDAFDGLLKQIDGKVFLLSNSDIMFICKGASAADIDAVVTRIRLLFSDDPLAQEGGDEGSHFATWFELDNNFNDLVAAVKKMAVEYEARKRGARPAAAAGGAPAPGQPQRVRQPLNPLLLGKLEGLLARTDLSNLMRRQSICAMTPGSPPQQLFRELYISIADLQKTVVPDVDLFADQWLFQRLTQTLDRRMLALMSRNDDSTLNSAISLNLNVSTVLSPEFLAFDKVIQTTARSSIVIELQKIDILADLGAFFFARDFLKERRYKICLDGINYITFPFINREKLGVDLIKLVFSNEMYDEKPPARGFVPFRELIEQTGRARVILSRVDTEDAVKFAHGHGITLFQGRFFDNLLTARTAGTAPPAQRPQAPRMTV